MPLKDFYYSDDVHMKQLIKDLKILINKYFFSEKTIGLLACNDKQIINQFLNMKKGITYEESLKIYDVIFSFKLMCEKFELREEK